MSRDWYLFVDDNDEEGQRPATKEEIQQFLDIAASRPEWSTTPVREGVTLTTAKDTR